MSEAVVHIQNFRMNFGRTTVIKDLSFDVYPGETFGFLGSNGSGKTTTIRALLGIYQATSGILHVNGAPFSPERSGKLGYLPEERGLYKKESVIDVMAYFGRLKGLNKKSAVAWSMNYLERVQLADKAKVRLDKLSSGQQQKVQLGVTLMNDPVLLILDEPTKGFDPVNRKLLMDIIDEQRMAGATVLMVTHQMEEVERLCDRVILLRDGVAHAYGTIEEVQSKFGAEIIFVQSPEIIPLSSLYEIKRQVKGAAELVARPGVSSTEILEALIENGISITSYVPKKPSLDDIFLEVYGAKAREGVA
ncbi:MAG: ABC transporter ATP-binding protein [Actinobacteria bacterium]|nr:ABC transporter ATP-binding protein [Actinomycetota bacterium]